jgi:hypothetical protein
MSAFLSTGEPMVRVQDSDGRGPFKPGETRLWQNPRRTLLHPPVFEEIGVARFQATVSRAHAAGLVVGCAASPTRLPEWFDAYEREKLISFGYRLVDATSCLQLTTTRTQRLIGKPATLADLPAIEWPVP